MTIKKILKSILIFLICTISIGLIYFFGYANNLKGISPTTLTYYQRLKTELSSQGYQPNLIVISSKRHPWHNQLLTYFGAAKNSQHLKGTALDIMVMDINNDGKWDAKDVKIVNKILEKLIDKKGGIGTYASEKWFWNRQMVHFDSRGYQARWDR